MSVTYIAYATPTVNETGADPGISIYRKVMEDGIVREEQEVLSFTDGDGEIDDDEGALDIDAAARFIESFGYRLAGSWFRSGGQEGVEVEPA